MPDHFRARPLCSKRLYRGGSRKRLREAILGLCRLCWLDREDVLLAAANLSNGIGLHAMDALILAGFLSAKATTIYSTDSDFEMYRKKGIRIIRI